MSHSPRDAILLDGGFVLKKLEGVNKRFPEATDIERLCNEWRSRDEVAGLSLLRIYFYHAPPAKDVLVNPIDKSRIDLAAHATHARHHCLLESLELLPDVAVRLGETVVHDWRLGEFAMKSLSRSARSIQPADLVPNITQKGVDLRIGLDIARLALREMVQAIVVVTGDSDFIPAFKFARREGVRVFLDTLGHGVRRDLKAHADRVF